jgi:hypothetical protein
MSTALNSSARVDRLLWIPPALLLIAAALAKAQEPLAFLWEISNYGFRLPPVLEALLAWLLPSLEMLLGCLLHLRNSRLAAALSTALLLFFSFGILAALPAGYLHRCGCLGPEKLDPTLALIKNGVAVALLALGFLPFARRAGKANAWGAMGVIIGGTAFSPAIAGIVILTSLLAMTVSRRVFFALLIGLALGFALKLTGFPLLALLVVGFVLYLFTGEERGSSAWRPVTLTVLVVATCWVGILRPAAPKVTEPPLEVGRPLPPSLVFEERVSGDAKGRSLLLFLQPDCDECRDWLPAAAAMSRQSNLPPLTGIIPGSVVNAEAFRVKEEITFDVKAMGMAAFNRMVRRTPLLVLTESGKVARIFAEGSLPPSSVLAEALR